MLLLSFGACPRHSQLFLEEQFVSSQRAASGHAPSLDSPIILLPKINLTLCAMPSSDGPSPPSSTTVSESIVTESATLPVNTAYANFAAAQTNAAPSAQPQGKEITWTSRLSKWEENTSFMEELLYGTSPAALAAKRNNYGLLGILKVIRMTDPGLNLLALGTDLTTLGLNLNAPDSLFPSFGSPCTDPFSLQQDQDYNLPACYNLQNSLPWNPSLQKVEVETLFYIFYNMTRDLLQAYAAAELYNRKWIYHKKNQKWFFLSTPNESASHASYGASSSQRWQFFDPISWIVRIYVGEIDFGEFLSVEEIKSIQEDGIEQVRQHQQVYATVSRTSSSTPVLQTHGSTSPPSAVQPSEMKSASTKEAIFEQSASHSLATDAYAS